MLVLWGVDALHGRAQRLQLILRLLPLAVVDQLLHLLHLGLRSQHHLLVTDPWGAEHGGVQAEQRGIRSGCVDRGAEATEAQQRGRDRADDGQRCPRFLAVQPLLEGSHSVTGSDGRRHRGFADAVAPVGEQEGQLGFGGVRRVRVLVGGERVEESVDASNLVERGVTAAR